MKKVLSVNILLQQCKQVVLSHTSDHPCGTTTAQRIHLMIVDDADDDHDHDDDDDDSQFTATEVKPEVPSCLSTTSKLILFINSLIL